MFDSVAIGNSAGLSGQQKIGIGTFTGSMINLEFSSSGENVKINGKGSCSRMPADEQPRVPIGPFAGQTNQHDHTVALGERRVRKIKECMLLL